MLFFIIFTSMIPAFAIILVTVLVKYIMEDMKDEGTRTWH